MMKLVRISFLLLLTFCVALVSCTDKDDDDDGGEQLARPTLMVPGAGAMYGANEQLLLFDWSDVDGAYKYSIEITDPFTSSVVFTAEVTTSEIQISREEFYNLDSYSWSVTAYNAINETAVSELRVFTYEFGDLQLQIPSNGAVLPAGTSSITLQCEDVGYIGISGYRFTVYRDGGFLVTQQTSATNTYTLTGLTSGTLYTWDATAIRSSGGNLPSNTWGFSVQ